jgi:hypothetical protein
MRYADGPSVEVDVLVRAPVGRVWDLVTDIGLPARFSAEFLGASWVDGPGPAPAARFVGRSRHDALGEWETTCTVITWEPQREFRWAVSDPDNPSSTWWFRLEPGPHGVRLVQGARMGPAPSGLTFAIERMPEKEERIVARRLAEFETNMRATVEGIKQLAEDGA